MVIDSHCHWLPEEIIANAHFFSKAWGDMESGLVSMSACGIDAALLTYPSSDAHLKLGGYAEAAGIFNKNISLLVKKYPGKIIGAAVLPVGDKNAMADEVRRAREEYGLSAVSLSSSYDGRFLDDAMFEPAYRAAAKTGMPVFVHSQTVNPVGSERVSDPLLTPVVEYVFDITLCIGRMLMSGMLREYAQEIKFVFANFAGAVPYLAARFDDTYNMLRGLNFVKDLGSEPTARLRNIYVDTGGERDSGNFLPALRFFGPGRLLWGSDWPAKKDAALSLQAVKNLGLARTQEEGILGGNAASILGIR